MRPNRLLPLTPRLRATALRPFPTRHACACGRWVVRFTTHRSRFGRLRVRCFLHRIEAMAGVVFPSLPTQPILWHLCRLPHATRGAFARTDPREGRLDRFFHTLVKRCGFHNPKCLPSTGTFARLTPARRASYEARLPGSALSNARLQPFPVSWLCRHDPVPGPFSPAARLLRGRAAGQTHGHALRCHPERASSSLGAAYRFLQRWRRADTPTSVRSSPARWGGPHFGSSFSFESGSAFAHRWVSPIDEQRATSP